MSNSLQTLWILLKRLMSLNIQAGAALFNSLLFFFVTIITFHIAIGPDLLAPDTAYGIIFCSFCFTLTLSSDRIFANDFRSGVVEELITSGVNEYLLFITYLASFSFIYILASLILIPAGYLIFGLPFEQLPHNILSTTLCILNVVLLLMLIRMITINPKTSPMLVILLAPFLIPILIITVISIESPNYCLLLLGLYLVMLPLSLFFSKLLLEEHL